MRKITQLSVVFTCCLAAAFATCELRADLIAADGYEIGVDNYTVGGLNGQTSVAATGFTGAWSVSSANLGADTITLENSAVDYESGGKGKFTASTAFSSFFRKAERTLDTVAAPANNTFYMSHLVNAGTLATNGRDDEGYAFVGFGSFVDQGRIEGTAPNLLGAFVGFVDSATEPAGVDLVLRSRTGTTVPTAVSDQLLVPDAENTTYNVVMALEFNNPGDTVRYWVNPSDLSSEAAMTASSTVNGSIAGFQLSAVSDMSRLSVVTYEFDRSFFWDESRLADSLNALIGIPEPSTGLIASLLISVAAAVRRRR